MVQHSSTTRLLMVWLVEDKGRMWADVPWVGLDDSTGWLLSWFELNQQGRLSLTLKLPLNGTCCTGVCSEPNLGTAHLNRQNEKSSSFSALASNAESAVLYVSPDFHRFVVYSGALKGKLAKRTGSRSYPDSFTISIERPWVLT